MASINQKNSFPTNQLRKSSNRLNNSKPTNKPTNVLILFLLFIAISYQLSAISYAAYFDGSLKSVTIPDSGGTNIAPTAVINFTQNGDTVDFDATRSTDDWSIVEYRWDFGDGGSGSGVAVNHQFALGTSKVTLTVIDNIGSVALSQVNILVSNSVKLRPKEDVTSEWTSSNGLNFSTVDDLIVDDTGYNSTTSAWKTDKFGTEDIAIQDKNISKIVFHVRAKASVDTTAFRISILLLEQGISSGNLALTANYEDVIFESVRNPFTNQQWTYSEINDLLISYRTLSSVGTLFVSQVYLEVHFE